MSKANNKTLRRALSFLIVCFGLVDFVLLLRRLMRGKNVALFNSKGLIAHEQRSLIIFIVSVLLTVAIPTLSLLYFTVWKYRESNTKARRGAENDSHNKFLAPLLWLIPATGILIIVLHMAPTTYKLAPQKAIVSDAKPLTIQVISLRWKWLFLYPQQRVASVNLVQIPVNTPVTFEMTADEMPMSSFWIPNLGGQLYSMTGHVNRLHLMADTLGDYPGSTSEINGAGFAGMRFMARVSSADTFNGWVQSVRRSATALDNNVYQNLLKPSQNSPPVLYSNFSPNLYNDVISKYQGPSGG